VIRGAKSVPGRANHDRGVVQKFAGRSPIDVGAAEALMQVQCVETRGTAVMSVLVPALFLAITNL
jgi:hypothetical protein